MGEETYITDHPATRPEILCLDVRKLRGLPSKCFEDQARLQMAWALLRRQVFAHISRLLRAHPEPLTTHLCDQVQEELQETFRRCSKIFPSQRTNGKSLN